LRGDADAAQDDLGIVVGNSNVAPTPQDYNLDAPISHGSGANQLVYELVSFIAPWTAGISSFFRILRTLSNESGGDVEIGEMGLVLAANDPLFGMRLYLVARDVWDDTFWIANGDSKIFSYTFMIVTN